MLLYRLTNRNIHDAREMEPKTPDRASCVVKGGPWASSAVNIGMVFWACKQYDGVCEWGLLRVRSNRMSGRAWSLNDPGPAQRCKELVLLLVKEILESSQQVLYSPNKCGRGGSNGPPQQFRAVKSEGEKNAYRPCRWYDALLAGAPTDSWIGAGPGR